MADNNDLSLAEIYRNMANRMIAEALGPTPQWMVESFKLRDHENGTKNQERNS